MFVDVEGPRPVVRIIECTNPLLVHVSFSTRPTKTTVMFENPARFIEYDAWGVVVGFLLCAPHRTTEFELEAILGNLDSIEAYSVDFALSATP